MARNLAVVSKVIEVGELADAVSKQPVIGFAPTGTQSPYSGQPKVMRLTALGEIAFEKTFWCGTCALLFSRAAGADRHVPPGVLRDRLKAGLDTLAPDVTGSFLSILTPGRYLPVLLEVAPVIVSPGDDLDYFTREQLQTWDLDQDLDGTAQAPGTSYYRLGGQGLHWFAGKNLLFEFLVPMFSPERNNPATVDDYITALQAGILPVAVAVSVADRARPWHEAPQLDATHWSLTHFLIDGHHKVQAAARNGATIRLLSFLAVDHGNLHPDYAIGLLSQLEGAPPSVTWPTTK